MTDLDIVIVNWNSRDLVQRCVQSLLGLDTRTCRVHVIVVDNASTDGSADFLNGNSRATLVRHSVNRGFAAACNAGAATGRSPFVLFLNPDTEVHGDALARAVAFMQSEKGSDVGVCGIQLRDTSGAVQRTCARFPTSARQIAMMIGLDRAFPAVFKPHFMLEFDHLSNRTVDEVMGAFLLVRRAQFTELGGLDERFFVYWEEVDYCKRALDRGWTTFFLADVYAMHVGGGSTDAVRATRLFYSLRSRVLYWFKHFSLAGAVTVSIASMTLEPAVRVLLAAVKRDGRGVRETVFGTLMLWRSIPGIVATAGSPPHSQLRDPNA